MIILAISGAIPAVSAYPDYAASELIVCFDTGPFESDVELELASQELHAQYNALVLENSSVIGIPGAQLVRLPVNVTVDEAVAWYESNSSVLFAEPNYIVTIPPPVPGYEEILADDAEKGPSGVVLASVYPDDTYYSTQWNIDMIGLPSAWDITTGSDSVIIAVLDTGIAYTLPELSGNIWTNEDEIPYNGIDDDLNGFIDDVNGWDFVNGDNSPMDDHGHGTEIASVIASIGNNGQGIAGVMWDVRIMPVKIGDPFYMSDTAKGIRYARDNGAAIIVCSFGHTEDCSLERTAIDQSPDQLFVCAAGNSAVDADIFPFYPACYSNANILSVTATDADDNLCYFSNYGQNSVDVGAPGCQIPAQSLDSQYYFVDGTSYAGPHVAGLAGLMLSVDPEQGPVGLRQLIMDNVDINQLNGYVRSAGRINAYKAVSAVSPVPEYTITATAGEGGTISPSGEVLVPDGSSRTFTIHAGSGYKISHVFVDGIDYGNIGTYTFSDVRESHTISAAFEEDVPQQYTITAIAGDGGSISPSGEVQVPAGSSRTFVIIPGSGYQVLEVVVDGVNAGKITGYTFTDVQSAHTITAYFEPATPYQLVMVLEPGWNFVSTPEPLQEGRDTFGEIFRDTDTAMHSIYSYDAWSGSWETLTGDDRMEPLAGIWVYSAQEMTVILHFSEDSETPPVSLPSSWNAIGCPSSSLISAREAFLPIVDYWVYIIGFDAGHQTYETSIINGGTGSHTDSFALIPGKGYWVYIQDPCIFQ